MCAELDDAPVLGVGLIGCGQVAAAHVRDYYAHQGESAELVACADVDPGIAAAFAEQHGVPVGCSVEELLARADVDVVDICSPPDAHVPLIEHAIGAGKHVLCEKPLALDWAGGLRVVESAAAAGVQLGVMQNFRWRPEYMDARTALSDGRLGRATFATLTAQLHWDGVGGYRRVAGPSLLAELTYHYVDLLRFLLDSDVARVYAAVGGALDPGARETYAVLIVDFMCGAVGSISTASDCQGVSASWGGTAMVQAERGTVYVNDPVPFRFAAYSPMFGGKLERQYPREMYSLSSNPPFTAPLRSYLEAIRDRKRLPVSARDNLNTLAAVLAAGDSAKSGQPVEVEQVTTPA